MSAPTCLEILTAVGSVGAAIAGCVAAYAAYKSAKAAETLIEAQTGPFVSVYIAARSDEPDMAVWVIENNGFSNAKNVNFQYENDSIYGIYDAETKKHSTIPKKHPFYNGIATLPPKCVQIYNINQWPELESRNFTIRWSYQSEQGKLYNSEFTWDDFKASRMTIPTPPLTRIARSLEEIAKPSL